MRAAIKRDYVSIEDYLAGEQASDIKHEYVGGAVYATAGATKQHNLVAGSIYVAIRNGFRGAPGARTFPMSKSVSR